MSCPGLQEGFLASQEGQGQDEILKGRDLLLHHPWGMFSGVIGRHGRRLEWNCGSIKVLCIALVITCHFFFPLLWFFRQGGTPPTAWSPQEPRYSSKMWTRVTRCLGGAVEIVHDQAPAFYSWLFLLEKETDGWSPVIYLLPLNTIWSFQSSGWKCLCLSWHPF